MGQNTSPAVSLRALYEAPLTEIHRFGSVFISTTQLKHDEAQVSCEAVPWAAVYWPSCASAERRGVLEIWISPSNERSSSMIRKIAPETEMAQTRKATATVPFRGGEEPKTYEDCGEPKDQHHQEGSGDRTVRLCEEQHARPPQIEGYGRRLGLQRTLNLVVRNKSLDTVVDRFNRGCLPVDGRRPSTVDRPKLLNHSGDGPLEHGTGIVCLRAVNRQGSVEQDDIGRDLQELSSPRIVRALG